MKCLGKEILTHYYDRELTQKDIDRVDAHLKKCPACSQMLQDIQKEITLTDTKLLLLKPHNIPDTPFTPIPARSAKAKTRPGKSWPELAKSAIRVPIPAFALLVLLVCLMAVGLFMQERKISRLQSPILAAKRQTTLYLISENRIQSLSLDAELEGFEPIKKPKIFVQKGGNK
jgi:predicted anti-sigma-YlaC factor YlaD